MERQQVSQGAAASKLGSSSQPGSSERQLAGERQPAGERQLAGERHWYSQLVLNILLSLLGVPFEVNKMDFKYIAYRYTFWNTTSVFSSVITTMNNTCCPFQELLAIGFLVCDF